jgi:hypothetical protein
MYFRGVTSSRGRGDFEWCVCPFNQLAMDTSGVKDGSVGILVLCRGQCASSWMSLLARAWNAAAKRARSCGCGRDAEGNQN